MKRVEITSLPLFTARGFKLYSVNLAKVGEDPIFRWELHVASDGPWSAFAEDRRTRKGMVILRLTNEGDTLMLASSNEDIEVVRRDNDELTIAIVRESSKGDGSSFTVFPDGRSRNDEIEDLVEYERYRDIVHDAQ